MATASAIGITVALLCAALLAVTAGTRRPERSLNASASLVFGAGVAYVIVIVGGFTNPGISLLSLFGFAAVAAVPAIVAAIIRQRYIKNPWRLGDSGHLVVLVAGIAVGLALLLGQLTAAGQILSTTGAVNRITASIAIGLVCALYLLPRGLSGAARTSRWLLWVLGVVTLLLVAIGAIAGEPGHITSPSVPVRHPSSWSYLTVALAATAAGAFDPALHRWLGKDKSPLRSGLRGAALLASFVILVGISLLMIFGGSFQAPSLQFFTIFALLPKVPIAILMALVAFMLASTTDTLLATGSYVLDNLLAQASESADAEAQLRAAESRRRVWTLVLAATAILLAVLTPSVASAFVAAGIVAAAAGGSLVPLILSKANVSESATLQPVVALLVGIAGALIVAAIAGFADTFTFSSRGAAAILIAFALATVVSVVAARQTSLAPVPESA